MKRKNISEKVCAVLVLLSLVCSFASCAKKTDASSSDGTELIYRTLDDFSGCKIGTVVGCAFSQDVIDRYLLNDISYYSDDAACVEALKKGDVDALLTSKSSGEVCVSQCADTIAMFPECLDDDELGFAFAKDNPLCDEFSEVIDRFREDGTLTSLDDKWMNGEESAKTIDDALYEAPENSKGTLTFYCATTMEPMSYVGENNKILGHDVELALLIAKELGYAMEIEDCEFDGLIPALTSGKADFIGGELSITDERKESVDFTSSIYNGGIYLITLKEHLASNNDIDLNQAGVKIACQSDTDDASNIAAKYPNAEIVYYDDVSAGLLAVQSGQVDAFVQQSIVLETEKASGAVDNLHIHSDGQLGETGKVAAAVSAKTTIPDAKQLFNDFLAEMRLDGTLVDMEKRWVVDKNYTMPEIATPENPSFTIKVGTTGLAAPYTFYQDNELTGYEIELAKRFAAWAGADVEFSTYDWAGIMAAAESGKVDYVISNLFVTEEREESGLMSNPYISFRMVLLVKDTDDTSSSSSVSLIEKFKDGFNKTFIKESRWKLILSGLGITLEITALSAVFGTILGFGLCFLRRSRKKGISKFFNALCYVISGIPGLVLLMLTYFVIFANVDIPAVVSAVITFSILFAVTVSGIMSTGIDSVDKGQWEGAKGLGFKNSEIFLRIIFPQTLRITVPVYKSELVGMMKFTSIVGYIAIQDLTKAGDIIRSRTFDAFFSLISVAVVYFIVSTIIIVILSKITVKIDYTKKPRHMPKGVDPDKHVELNTHSVTAENGEELIRLEHVKKAYEQATPLKDVNTVIRRGDVISIIGPSGTGKSTLMRMINRMEEPTDGKIFVEGKDEDESDMNLVRRKMGMVFQSFNLFNHLNVIENVMLAPVKLLGQDRQYAYENAMRLLRLVGMAERATNMPDQLSGGQKQRVAIARTLAMDPEIILFDEPTSALDPTMVGEVLEVITNLAQHGMTMMIVTHEMNFARNVSNRVFYMDDGGIYEDDSPDVIFENPARTRTQIFIRKLKTATITVESSGYDFVESVCTLENFADRYKLSDTVKLNLRRCFEEILTQQELIPAETDEHKLHIIAEYSEANGSVSLMFIRESAEYNPMEHGDEIAMKLVGASITGSTFVYEDGINKLKLDIKAE